MLLIAMYAMLYLLFYTFYSMNYILSNWFRISFVGSGDLIFGNAEYLFAYDDKKCPVQNRKQVTGLSKIQLRNFKNFLKTSPGSEEPVKKNICLSFLFKCCYKYPACLLTTLHNQHWSVTSSHPGYEEGQLDYFLLSIQSLQC